MYGAHQFIPSSIPAEPLIGSVDFLMSGQETPGYFFVILPLVNADNNQHSFDENLRIGHYVEGMQTLLQLLRTRYQAG